MSANPFRKSPAGSSASGSPSPVAAGGSRSGAPGSETKLPLVGTSPAQSSSSPAASVSPARRREFQGKAPKPTVIPEADDEPHSSSSPVTAVVKWAPSYTRPGDSASRRPSGAGGGAREHHLQSPGVQGPVVGSSSNHHLSGTSHVSATSAAPTLTSLRTPEPGVTVERATTQPQSPGPAAMHANAFGSLTSFGGSVGGGATAGVGGGGGIPTWRVSTGGFGGQGSDEDTSRCFSVMSADPGSVTDTPSGLQPTGGGGYGVLGDAMHTTAATMRRYSGNSMLTMPNGSDRERGTADEDGGGAGSLPDMLPETADNDMTLLSGLVSSPDPLNRTASPVPFVSKRVMPEWKDEDFQPAEPAAAGGSGPRRSPPKRAQVVAPGESPASSRSSSGGRAVAAAVSATVVVHVPPRRVAFAP